MTEYAILLPGNEAGWESASDEQRSAMYARHNEFAARLAERGHKVTGGAELTHSRDARLVRGAGTGISVTEGPYAETVEQLTGFYLVETDNLDDMLQVVGVLTGDDGVAEVRACVDRSIDG
ncbi:MAG: YciI family protein [Actinomycetota bacterium]|nr:YciI family protein [Actinomycetota bacterium]